MLLLCLFLLIISPSFAEYSASDDVIQLSTDFEQTVVKSNELWLVEFYAPWCGHCKSLEPEYKKVATALKGIVKVAAVDADAHKSVAAPYGVTGFPTLKFFGPKKKSPESYDGARTADAIVEYVLKQVDNVVNQRLGKKAKSKESKGTHSEKGPSTVVELTESNFEKEVLQSEDIWLVEFFAPWCGHCKNLAPHWESAAKKLKGKVKLGAVDATVHGGLASKYGVKGYPTIKVWTAGPKGEPKDYDGGRETDGIITYAQNLIAANAPPPEIYELTSDEVFDEHCAQSSLCVLAFLPNILDSKAKGRNAYIEVVRSVADAYKTRPFTYLWVEGYQQLNLESAFGVGGAGYPALVAVNNKKAKYSSMVTSFTKEGMTSFFKDLMAGRLPSIPFVKPTITTSTPWDGKDGVLPKSDNDDVEIDKEL